MKKLLFVMFFIGIVQGAFCQSVNFGHAQNSGAQTSSFGVFRNEYDDYTDVFYWDSVTHEQDIIPTVYGGIDENYWNAGVSADYKSIYGSFIFYEQIANYKNWPNNMTDLGLAATIGIRDIITVQARYYDFCYSGGKGTAVPGLTIAKSFGDSSYKPRAAVGCDLSFWYLEPLVPDMIFPRSYFRFDFSKDSMNGIGFKYLIVPRIKGSRNQVDIDTVSTSHTFSLWIGFTKDFERFSVGVRPNSFVSINAINPTEARVSVDGPEAYNPYAHSGNREFLVRLPVSIKYNLTEAVDFFFSVKFGLYHANFDHYSDENPYTGLGGNNNKGWVCEKGIGFGLNFEISPKCNVQVASNFTRIPEYAGDNHFYKAKNVSLANIAKEPLTVSAKFQF